MPSKHSSKNKTHHRKRHSYQSRSGGSSSGSYRGRSRSRSSSSGRARSSSPLLRSHSQISPPSSTGSYTRSRKQRNRGVPVYIPSSERHTHIVPRIIAEALRQDQDQIAASLTATNLRHRLPTPPPEPNLDAQGAAARSPSPRLKRRLSSSPAAVKTRRRRTRRPRVRQPSVPSSQDEPVLPPEPSPSYHATLQSPTSLFGFIRAREKEKREVKAKKKRIEERKKKRKLTKKTQQKTPPYEDAAGYAYAQNEAEGAWPVDGEDSMPRRSTSAPPMNRSPYYEGQTQQEYDLYDDDSQDHSPSQRRHQNHNRHKQPHQQRRKKHHRRQKRRSSRHGMRDFFASLRRKLGNFFRLTVPLPSSAPVSAPTYPRSHHPRPHSYSYSYTSPPPAATSRLGLDYSSPYAAYSYTATVDPATGEYYSYGSGGVETGNEGDQHYYQHSHHHHHHQKRGRKRRSQQQKHEQVDPNVPYEMHGGRSPADSWHSRLTSTRRFTFAGVESAPVSRAASPSPLARCITPHPHLEIEAGVGTGAGGDVPKYAQHHASGSAISIIARRFMGPFFSEPNSENTTSLDGGSGSGGGGGARGGGNSNNAVDNGGGNGGLLQRRLSWARSYKLLTAGSRPATPPLSRSASPNPEYQSLSLSQGRGRSTSHSREGEEMLVPACASPDLVYSNPSPYDYSCNDGNSNGNDIGNNVMTSEPVYSASPLPSQYHCVASPSPSPSPQYEYGGGLADFFAATTPLRAKIVRLDACFWVEFEFWSKAAFCRVIGVI
ncbi:hypothetical protein F4808DRAFT_464976 [Astrocystis sublimbata]|nr:hypothetical protein F4808DRAFT_464976 [Astrocystis sublimbata]